MMAMRLWWRSFFWSGVQRKGLRCIYVAKLRRIYVAKMQRKSNENICVAFLMRRNYNTRKRR